MTNFNIGDRVKVVDQDICGVIVGWDGADAVVLADVDDDRDEWMEEDDDGTLVFPISQLNVSEDRSTDS